MDGQRRHAHGDPVLGGDHGCDSGSSEPGQPLEHDDRLFTAILDLAEAGKSQRLAALTEFAWDEVYVYYEGASADDIAGDVGTELEMNDYYESAGRLMVFVGGDDVVRAISAPELVSWGRLEPVHRRRAPGAQPRRKVVRPQPAGAAGALRSS